MFSLDVQVLSLLRGSTVQGSVYQAVVAIAEGMHARHSDMTNELITKPLLDPLLKCLESTGRAVFISAVFHCGFLCYPDMSVACLHRPELLWGRPS